MSFVALARAAFAAAMLAATPALASTAELRPPQISVLLRIDDMLARREWQQACDLLESRFGSSPSNVEVLVRRGECRSGQGQFGLAIADYRRILLEVDSPIIAARLMFLEIAAAEGIIVVDHVPEALPPPILAGEASLGVLLDSNANAGTSATSVTAMLGGFPIHFAISDDSQGKPDNALTLGLSGSYMQPLNAHVALTGRAGASASLYTIDPDLSRQTVYGRAGVVVVNGPVSGNLQAGAAAEVRGGAIGQFSANLDARGAIEVLPGFSIGLGGSLGHATVISDPARDSVTRIVTAGVEYQLTPGISASFDYLVSRSDANSALHSNWSHGPRVGASVALGPLLQIGLGYSFELADHDEALVLFPQGRRDATHEVSATLGIDLSELVAEGASATIGYSYRSTDSTIDLYDQNRHAITAGMRYTF